jgi:acyl dehydratase
MSSLKITDEFEGETVTISEEEIEAFCRVVGNEGEAYKKGYKKGMQVPLDFAIKLGWKVSSRIGAKSEPFAAEKRPLTTFCFAIQSIMKPIFPSTIDGDLLKLVHLSNGFRVLPGAPTLVPGDVVTSTSRIESVTNSDSGKTVSVRGTVYLVSSASDKGKESTNDRVAVLEVTSSFLYRGKFTDYAQTFSRVPAPHYSVPLKNPESLAVLRSKEWFQWDDDSTPLEAGTTLQFRVESNYVYADKSSYSQVNVTGGAYIITQEQKLAIKVATVEYSSEGEGVTKGDPVIEYLKRHGSPLEQPILFENGGYSLNTEGQCTFATPVSNADYSATSGDTNPIHTNPYFASLASLPGTITHGMHSSARTRRFVEQIAAENVGGRVKKYEVGFTAMCLPDRAMEVKLKHIGMTAGGNKLVKVDTVDVEASTVVLTGTAEIEQAPVRLSFSLRLLD